MTNQDILKSLPLLASVLGRQYGVQVTVGGSSAYTNGRTVNIPALPLDADSEVLGMVRGYIDHEAGGHLRFTDFDVRFEEPLNPAEHFIWNAIEDWRVEKALSDVYPGCKANLEWLARKLFVDEFTPSRDVKKAVMNYILLTCRAWSVPEIEASRQVERKKIARHYPELLAKLDAQLALVCANCPDTQAAIDHAKQIAALIESHREPQQQEGKSGAAKGKGNEQSQGQKGDKEQEEEQQQSQGQEGAQADVGQDGESGQAQSQGQEGEDSGQDGGQSPEQEQTQDQTDQADQDADDAPALKQSPPLHITEKNLPETFSKRLAEKLGTASSETPDYKLVHTAVAVRKPPSPLPAEEQRTALAATTGLRYRLQGKLQAMRLKDTAPNRHGKLCPHSLHRVFVNNPKVFRRDAPVPAVNTAVHILVDCSGSMDGTPIEQARQACFAIAHALKSVPGINLGVTAFPAESKLFSVVPVLEHGQPFHANFDLTPTGSTPMTEALLWTAQELCRQPEPRKIILLLTDGSPDNPVTFEQAIKEVSRFIEIYGVGLRDTCIKTFLPDASAIIYDLSELSSTLFNLLQTSLFSRR